MQHEEVQVINSKLDLVSHLNGVMFIDQSQNEVNYKKNNVIFYYQRHSSEKHDILLCSKKKFKEAK